MATEFGSKLVIAQLTCEISFRFLRLTGGFRGRAIERCQPNSTSTDPGCHGNEIWVKIGYNSAYTTDISEILASNWCFSASGYWTTSVKFYHDRHGCHSNEMWVKIGYKSACMTDISTILASTVGFQRRVIEPCQSNSSTSDDGCHCNENWTKTRLNTTCISQILKSSKGFQSRAIKRC